MFEIMARDLCMHVFLIIVLRSLTLGAVEHFLCRVDGCPLVVLQTSLAL